MIAEWFAGLGMDIAIMVAGWFPEWDIPQVFHDMRGGMLGLLETYTGLGVWVDWGALGVCLTAVAIAYGLGILIRLVRAALAHLPAVGGSGA